jgi:hypothetical protein
MLMCGCFTQVHPVVPPQVGCAIVLAMSFQHSVAPRASSIHVSRIIFLVHLGEVIPNC